MLAQREQIKGAFLWSLLQVFSERVVQAILFFVIAKLLGPEDLGVASIAVTISAIATYIMQGVVQYVVQIRDDSERHLSALFAIAIAVSLCMSASAAVGGHLLARALDAEQLIGLSYVCALSPLAAALGAIPEGLLIRRFEFRILALRKPIGVTLAGICCVLLALAGYGAWSVVIQSVFTTFITSFICVIGSKWRPSARFTLSDSLKCASGSLKLMLNLAADVLSHRAPELIIGIAIGASAVGYFRVAKSLYDLVISISLFPLSSVLLPIYSRGSEEGSAKKF
ncbi:oligosaccharide flippase family protein [Methylobacterium phyllosphaerae]